LEIAKKKSLIQKRRGCRNKEAARGMVKKEGGRGKNLLGGVASEILKDKQKKKEEKKEIERKTQTKNIAKKKGQEKNARAEKAWGENAKERPALGGR